MIHLDSLLIPNGTQFACSACEGVIEAGSKATRMYLEWSTTPGSSQQLALYHPACARDVGGDMVGEIGR